jgi:hypothetical protein
MTPEEYERIKQAEKEHLRKLKKLKEAHRQLQRQAKVTKAVTDMTSSMQEKLDLHADMMDRIATESAINEARLEMAIESRELEDADTRELEDELEMTKIKARELIRRLKEDSSVAAETGSAPVKQSPGRSDGGSAARRTAKKEAVEERKDPGDHLPEKTIGRMKPSGDSSS